MYAEVSSRDADNDVDASFLDGCALLWVVPWPTSGTVQDYLDRFRSYIHRRLKKTDVYLVFDRRVTLKQWIQHYCEYISGLHRW